MADLLVRVGDGTVPLARCHWVLFDGQDCAHGSLRGDECATADQAHAALTARKRDRDRQTRTWWHVRLLTPVQWDEQARDCMYGRCHHVLQLDAHRHLLDPVDRACAALAPGWPGGAR